VSADWLWLYMQVIALAAIALREMRRPRSRNLYAILMAGGLLVMVQGQAWWLFAQFEQSGLDTFQHLNQFISLDGARRANAYVGVAVLALTAVYAITAWRNALGLPRQAEAPDRAIFSAPHVTIVAGFVFVVAAAFVISLAGGPVELILHPGQSLARGLTMFLLIASVGKLPALDRLSVGVRPGFREIALFAATTAIVLLNSRFLAVFLLLQMTVIANYGYRELSRRLLFGAFAAVFAVLIVFGLYRDVLAKQQSGYAAPDDYVEPRIGAVTNWFYRSNIEGFVGLAGLLTFEDRKGPIAHDLGVSELRVLTQFLPFSIRTDPGLPFAGIATYLQGRYPYSGSVVSSGLENAYAHLGLPGVVGLGALLGWLATSLHVAMSNKTRRRLVVGIVSVHALQLVRGSFFNALFFGISELLIVAMLAVLVRVLEVVRRLPPPPSRPVITHR
jgi:hypothetical protein